MNIRGWVLLGATTFLTVSSFAEPAVPPFEELFKVLRSEMKGLSETDLDRAASRGLLQQLYPRVMLITNDAPASPDVSDLPLIAGARLHEESGYVRVARIAPGLAEKFQESYRSVSSSNKLNGLILDLRFALGRDFEAAGQLANVFGGGEGTLLDWGEGNVRATEGGKGIPLPLVILVNQETSGAAEALAGILRETRAGVVIGAPTAGQASQFKEVTVAGSRLRVASAPVKIANGKAMPANGLTPDIQVMTPVSDERVYLEDPFRPLPRLMTNQETNSLSSLSSTNRGSRRRINEAELVRLQRESVTGDEDLSALRIEPDAPYIRDPALARGIDLLKALSVVQQSRPR